MSFETPPTQTPVKTLRSIQMLRGIAALVVLVYHLFYLQGLRVEPDSTEFTYTQGLWERGGIGVDLFFVISGFIMVYVTQGWAPGWVSVRKFLVRRVQRIYPLWWLCAAIMAIYFYVSYGMPAAPDRIAGPTEAWIFAAKSFALWPTNMPPVLGVGWTLSHEIFFYMVFALSLLVARKWLPWILLVWLIFTGLAVLFGGSLTHELAVWRLIGHPMTAEFIIGAYVGYLFIHRSAPILFGPRIWLGVALIYLIFATAQNWHIGHISDVSRTLVYTLPFAALIWGLSRAEQQGTVSISTVFVRLGDWSYALYLSHYITLVAWQRIMEEADRLQPGLVPDILRSEAPGILNNWIAAGVDIGLSLIVAAILYYGFERPVMRLFRRPRAPTRSRA